MVPLICRGKSTWFDTAATTFEKLELWERTLLPRKVLWSTVIIRHQGTARWTISRGVALPGISQASRIEFPCPKPDENTKSHQESTRTCTSPPTSSSSRLGQWRHSGPVPGAPGFSPYRGSLLVASRDPSQALFAPGDGEAVSPEGGLCFRGLQMSLTRGLMLDR